MWLVFCLWVSGNKWGWDKVASVLRGMTFVLVTCVWSDPTRWSLMNSLWLFCRSCREQEGQKHLVAAQTGEYIKRENKCVMQLMLLCYFVVYCSCWLLFVLWLLFVISASLGEEIMLFLYVFFHSCLYKSFSVGHQSFIFGPICCTSDLVRRFLPDTPKTLFL